MKCTCDTNVLYAIVCQGRAWRFTFSKDLALFIHSKNPNHEIWKLDMVIDDEATKESSNCIFGIVNKKNGKLLRAASTYEEAKLLSDDVSRYVAECRARRMEKWKNGRTKRNTELLCR